MPSTNIERSIFFCLLAGAAKGLSLAAFWILIYRNSSSDELLLLGAFCGVLLGMAASFGTYTFEERIHYVLIDASDDYNQQLIEKLRRVPMWFLVETQWISRNFTKEYKEIRKQNSDTR